MGNRMATTEGINIKAEEEILITSILELVGSTDRIASIPEVVYDLNDGGMGTIKFTSDNEKEYAEDILEVNNIDSDKTPVKIALTFDNKGELFELDFWKVNFEKLIEFPQPKDITIED